MDYAASLEHVQQIFLRHDFAGHQANGRRHAVTTQVEACQNGTIISLCFPGYKATPTKPDYRVDITKNGLTTSLSHANIIVDIVTKCSAGGMQGPQLGNALAEQAARCDLDYAALAARLPYTPVPPSLALLAAVRVAHGDKTFNAQGNAWDLTVEELFKSIKWIVMQEDINYPISQGYLGRKMPYGRYLEALHVLEDNQYTLAEVIQRALTHYRPQKWAGMDYSFEQAVR